MSIKVGDKVPNINFTTMTADGPAPVGYDDLFAGKRVALFSVPGAFTPTCPYSIAWLYTESKELTARLTQLHMAVNDVFVMDAWGKSQDADGKVMMLADGNGLHFSHWSRTRCLWI